MPGAMGYVAQWKIRTIWVQHQLILMIHAIGRAYFWHNLLGLHFGWVLVRSNEVLSLGGITRKNVLGNVG